MGSSSGRSLTWVEAAQVVPPKVEERGWVFCLGEAVLHSNTISVSGLLKLIGYIYLSIYLSINLIYLLI